MRNVWSRRPSGGAGSIRVTSWSTTGTTTIAHYRVNAPGPHSGVTVTGGDHHERTSVTNADAKDTVVVFSGSDSRIPSSPVTLIPEGSS